MAEDGDVLRQVWDAKLPVSFRLSDQDLCSIKSPEPYYSMVPRVSYFSLIIDKVIVYFSQFIDSTTKSAANLWLDFLGIPLKLNYPIGLLYDLYAADIELPWSITVNFDRFPTAQIMRCNTRASIESTYMYCLKEADVIKHRTPLVNQMQKRDHNQLWSGLVQHNFHQFWSINRRLMAPDPPLHQPDNSSSSSTPKSSPEPPPSQSPTPESFRHIPYRLYLPSKGGETALFIQKLVLPYLKSGGGGAPACLSHLLEQALGVDAHSVERKYRIVVHGIEPPLDTPLQWASEHLSYPDNFLHIVMFDRTTTT